MIYIIIFHDGSPGLNGPNCPCASLKSSNLTTGGACEDASEGPCTSKAKTRSAVDIPRPTQNDQRCHTWQWWSACAWRAVVHWMLCYTTQSKWMGKWPHQETCHPGCMAETRKPLHGTPSKNFAYSGVMPIQLLL